MDLELGHFYEDNDENVYRCIALASTIDGYAEAVLRMEGYADTNTMIFSIFYRSHYAWLDRENPDFRLTTEVDYFPHSVAPHGN